jgi:hypothetical protein
MPMPKRLCTGSGTIRTLATGAHSGILTDLDDSTFILRKQARNLPVIYKLFLSPELNSLGYTQPMPKEIHPSCTSSIPD